MKFCFRILPMLQCFNLAAAQATIPVAALPLQGRGQAPHRQVCESLGNRLLDARLSHAVCIQRGYSCSQPLSQLPAWLQARAVKPPFFLVKAASARWADSFLSSQTLPATPPLGAEPWVPRNPTLLLLLSGQGMKNSNNSIPSTIHLGP